MDLITVLCRTDNITPNWLVWVSLNDFLDVCTCFSHHSFWGSSTSYSKTSISQLQPKQECNNNKKVQISHIFLRICTLVTCYGSYWCLWFWWSPTQSTSQIRTEPSYLITSTSKFYQGWWKYQQATQKHRYLNFHQNMNVITIKMSR